MNAKHLIPLLVATALGSSALSFATTPALAQNTAATAAAVPAADAHTRSIVDAANSFLATLSAAQKDAALFEFTDTTQRYNWSNFPQGGAGVKRVGVPWGEMSDEQRNALMALLGTVLSEKGVTMVKEQMAADDIVKATDTGQGPLNAQAQNSQSPGNQAAPDPAASVPVPASGAAGGPATGSRPAVSFGSEFYFVSFVGAPSTTSPWMLQFGGHHLAINATIVGPNLTLSPTLSGGEPLKFTEDGKAVYIVADEVNQSVTLLSDLTQEQLGKLVLSPDRIDPVLGPGKDGMTLQPEGLAGSDMTAQQRQQFIALIKARLDILNADDLAATMSPIEKNIDQTYLAWYGPTDEPGAAYWRIIGPTVSIEFSPQANDGDPTNHAHNMYRDPTNEYGAAWTIVQ